MLDVASADIRAVVVGIDIYDYGDAWTLRGPTSDALRTVDWLLASGVESKHIALFLSAPSWETSEVTGWMDANNWTIRRDAAQHAISSFFNIELNKLGGKALLLHWGGHGAVDEATRQNCLFTADAVRDAPHCLSAQDLLQTLSDVRLSHLAQQVHIFDMCASPFSRLGTAVLPNPARLFKTGKVELKVQQCAMFASSLGRVAANISKRGTGLFSELIFAELKKHPSPTMADFGSVFKAVVDKGKENGLNAQHPRLQFKGVADPELELGSPVPAQAAPDLLALIEARKHPLDLLKRLYLQSLPVLPRDEPGHAKEDWLHHLADARPRAPGYGGPLIEFAERLARATADGAYRTWAQNNAEPGPYENVVRKLDEERVADRPIATLFVAIESETSEELHWWIEAPDPADRSRKKRAPLGKLGLIPALEACLPPIVLEASGVLESRYRMRIGFIVPAQLFSKGLESLQIRWGDDSYRLDEQYPVLFHWHDRAIRNSPRYVTNWQQIMRTLGPRIQSGGNAGVQWLDAPTKTNLATRHVRAPGLLQASPVGAVCLGIDHPHSHAPEAGLTTVVECLKSGVPCLFWLQLPRSAQKAKELRTRVATAFASVPPATAPVAIWDGRKIWSTKEQLVPIGMVWDIPAFLPANTSVQSRFEEST
jgi:hypothetical protein